MLVNDMRKVGLCWIISSDEKGFVVAAIWTQNPPLYHSWGTILRIRPRAKVLFLVVSMNIRLYLIALYQKLKKKKNRDRDRVHLLQNKCLRFKFVDLGFEFDLSSLLITC